MNTIKREFKQTILYFKEHINKISLLMACAFLLVAIAMWLYLNQDQTMLKSIMQSIYQMFDAKDLIDAQGSISVFSLIMNNLQACFISVIVGMIPFLFLPLFSLILNAAIVGAMGSLLSVTGISMMVFLAGIMPHGIFELPALFISMAMGVYACKEISKRILGKTKELTPVTLFLPLAKIFVFINVPLIIIAGFIEAYITPIIMNSFL